MRNSGLQPQSVLYVTDDPAAEGRVLLDPNAMSKDGTVAISGLGFSDDGRLLAYAIADAGSDWQIWRVRDVDDREGPGRRGALGQVQRRLLLQGREGLLLLPLRRASRGGEAHRGQPEPEGLVPRRRHAPGRRRPGLRAPGPAGLVPPGHGERRRALARASGRTKGTNPESAIFVQDLATPGSRPEPLLARMDAAYDFVDVVGDTFYFLTDRGAPRKRLVAVVPGPAGGEGLEGESSPRPREPTCCATSPRWATVSSPSGCAT